MGWHSVLESIPKLSDCTIFEITKKYLSIILIQIPSYFIKGPFEMLKYECEGDFEWTHIKFSPNGKMILVSTNTSLILLVDAFSGVLLHTFTVR